MSGFLEEMARSSEERVSQAKRLEAASALAERARRMGAAPPLKLSGSGFDVIAELKLRSPALGVLREASHDWQNRVRAYARAGAAAVSVLTEPTRFDGSLEHLNQAVRVLTSLGVPAMRKDFIVDPYQVLEARAAGAGGVLVILRMLRREQIEALLDTAAEHGLFVLLEAFDADDLKLAQAVLEPRPRPSAPVLIGVNCRDLATLNVVQSRFSELAPLLPKGTVAVAESGVATAEEARAVRLMGYRAALIGTALMTHEDPASLLGEIFAATRTVQS